MTESNISEASALATPDLGAAADQPQAGGETRLEQLKSSVKHAVESAVDKVSDTLHVHRGDGEAK